MSFSFFSHGQGEVSKHERERAVSVSVMAKTDKGIFLLFYSCSASKQTVWFIVFYIFDDHTFYINDTYFRGISSQSTESAIRPNRS